MNYQDLAAKRQRLASAAAERFVKRQKLREDALTKVERDGVLAAAGMASAVRRVAHMTVNEGRTLAATRKYEAILGADDSDPVNFLSRGGNAARAVCRLCVDGSPVGTGFLVAPGIVLTNNHVIASEEEAAEFTAEFDFELDDEDKPRAPVIRFALAPKRLFTTSDADSGLDFTFSAIAERSLDGSVPLARFGWIPLDPRIDKILVGEPAVIIQHPRGEFKRVAMFAAELADKLDDFLHYTTDTDGGASGSCVMNRSWQLVALHHAAVQSGRSRRGHPVIVNEGIRVSSILQALQDRPQHVVGDAAETLAAISRGEVVKNGRPQAGVVETVIVQESVQEFGREMGQNLGRTTLEATKIRTRPKTHFQNRDEAHFGYKSNFLGIEVPLPKLAAYMIEDIAPVEGSGYELKYTHFSAAISKSRRIPFYTAVNIDGKLSKRLSRTDRRFEAADVWYYDPRLDPKHQLGPAIYDRTDFDFGHLVRREDPVWGDLNTSRMANDDTFSMPNAAPQHHDLNTKTWLALEDAILGAARRGAAKVTVMTGPVLSPQDPEVLDVQVPTAFWKVVTYVEQGKLKAHGFMQWQTKLVRSIKVRPEALAGLETAAAYAVPIREISRSTGLDFGQVGLVDVLATGTRRRIRESTVHELFTIPRTVRGTLEEITLGSREIDDDAGESLIAETASRDELQQLRKQVADLTALVQKTLQREELTVPQG